MAIIERDVLLMGKDGGHQTMDFPITRLGNVEDTADVKEAPAAGDYLPIVDSEDGGQMKKTTVAALFAPHEVAVQEALDVVDAKLSAKQDKLTGAHGQVVGFGEDGTPEAQDALKGMATKEEVAAKQDKLTGQPGQVVGFGEDGAPVARDALTMDEVNAAINAAIAGAIEEVY